MTKSQSLKTTERGPAILGSRAARGAPARFIYLIGTLAAGSAMIGCALPRTGWRSAMGLQPSGSVQSIPTNSIAGRVERFDQLTESASSMSPSEAAGHARSIADELVGEVAAPVKIAMVRCLGALPSPVALDGLSIAVRDADAEVRNAACRALLLVDSPRAMELLAGIVAQDDDVDVRLTAIRGLASFRDPRAVQALGQSLEDRDPAVQYVAMQSLREITGEDLGYDVRVWKDAVANPTQLVADRPTQALNGGIDR